MDLMTFSEALEELKLGGKVCRLCWEDSEYLAVQYPDEDSKMGRPYLYKHKPNGRLFPYMLCNSDLFASNWLKYEEEKETNETPQNVEGVIIITMKDI